MKHSRGFWRLLAGMFLVLAVGGCSSVTIMEPLPMISDAVENARFQGEWVMGDQIFYMRFGSNGIGQFVGVDWGNDQFQLEKGEFIVSKGSENSFLSVRVLEKGKWQEGYFLVQYHFTKEGDLLLWRPEANAFADAVEKGKLKGTTEKGKSYVSVVITSPPERILAFVNDPSNGALFDCKEPLVFKRLILKNSSQ
jgi:hypothetical protein